jgi:hypothetical protein
MRIPTALRFALPLARRAWRAGRGTLCVGDSLVDVAPAGL